MKIVHDTEKHQLQITGEDYELRTLGDWAHRACWGAYPRSVSYVETSRPGEPSVTVVLKRTIGGEER